MSSIRTSLAELAEVITKGTTPTTLGHEFVETGIPFLRVQNIEGGKVNFERDTLFIDSQTHAALSRSRIRPGDVLLSIAGSIGRAGIVPMGAPALNCNQAVAIIRPKKVIHGPFLRLWLEGFEAQKQIRNSTVTGTISNLSLSQLGGLQIPLPPLEEQKRIANILDKADAIRRKRQEALRLTDEFLRSVFLEMFGDPNTVGSQGAKITQQKELGNFVRIRTGKLDANAADTNGNFPFFTCAAKTLRINKIAFDCKAVLVAGNGDLNVKYHEGPFNAYQRTYVIESLDENQLLPKFLFAFLSIYVEELRRKSIGGVIKYIKLEYLTKAIINLPALQDQIEFVRKADVIEKIKNSQKTSEEHLEKLFLGLQQKAFNGEL